MVNTYYRVQIYILFCYTGRQPNYEAICSTGEKLRAHGQLASKTISHRLNQLQENWRKLKDKTNARKSRLEEAVQYQQVLTSRTSISILVTVYSW